MKFTGCMKMKCVIKGGKESKNGTRTQALTFITRPHTCTPLLLNMNLASQFLDLQVIVDMMKLYKMFI